MSYPYNESNSFKYIQNKTAGPVSAVDYYQEHCFQELEGSIPRSGTFSH